MKNCHIQHLSRTPVMACGGSPSTTAFLPCLLTIIADSFAAVISGVGAFTPLVGFVTGFVVDTFEAVPLAFRNLPWKIVGPIV